MIGLFGGTFDPVHFGHLNLAIELFEKKRLKEVWFIPAACSPLRQEALASGSMRKAMLELAVKDLPFCHVLDAELQRGAPSYTIDTVQELKRRYPSESFALLMGEDAALQFPSWKEALHLTSLVTPLVGTRKGVDLRKKINIPLMFNKFFENALVEIHQMDIEATYVRQRLGQGSFCGHLIPAKVLDFIYENQLYFTR